MLDLEWHGCGQRWAVLAEPGDTPAQPGEGIKGTSPPL